MLLVLCRDIWPSTPVLTGRPRDLVPIRSTVPESVFDKRLRQCFARPGLLAKLVGAQLLRRVQVLRRPLHGRLDPAQECRHLGHLPRGAAAARPALLDDRQCVGVVERRPADAPQPTPRRGR